MGDLKETTPVTTPGRAQQRLPRTTHAPEKQRLPGSCLLAIFSHGLRNVTQLHSWTVSPHPVRFPLLSVDKGRR